EVTAADQPERHATVEAARSGNGTHEAATRIGKVLIRETWVRQRLHADQSVFRLKEHLYIARQVARHHGRQPASPIHKIAALRFERDAARDEFLSVHSRSPAARSGRRGCPV